MSGRREAPDAAGMQRPVCAQGAGSCLGVSGGGREKFGVLVESPRGGRDLQKARSRTDLPERGKPRSTLSSLQMLPGVGGTYFGPHNGRSAWERGTPSPAAAASPLRGRGVAISPFPTPSGGASPTPPPGPCRAPPGLQTGYSRGRPRSPIPATDSQG